MNHRRQLMLTPAQYDALLRQDFVAFTIRCFYYLHPTETYQHNWHLEVMAAKLETCRRGACTRLIINVPPRSLKSICASVALVAWLLGHNPSVRIICVSYGQELADKHALDCRDIMMSAWYERLFPATRLSPQKLAVNEFMTTAHGCRIATSVEGVLTGLGADVVIIDDPLKPEEALSDTQRQKVNHWFDHTLYSRLNDKQTSGIILIMQRLHQDDLVGHVLEREHWEHLCFPAIAQEDEVHIIVSPYGMSRFERKACEVLHAERESRDTLDRIRQRLGDYHFAGQYQQAPAPFGGGMVKDAWFQRYEPDQVPPRFDRIVQSWDTANTAHELSDYSVCTTWGIKDGRIYLLHVLRKRVNYPDLKRAVHEQQQAFRPDVILIEEKASGTQLIQELLHEGLYAVARYTPAGDKIMRMDAQTAMIANGFVYLPRQAHWVADYLQELTTFPNSKYKDQADSTSQALDWIKKGAQEPAMLQWIREECEKQSRLRLGEPPLREPLPWSRSQPPATTNPLTALYWKTRNDLQVQTHRCAACGQLIEPPGATYIQAGVREYHSGCYKPFG